MTTKWLIGSFVANRNEVIDHSYWYSIHHSREAEVFFFVFAAFCFVFYTFFGTHFYRFFDGTSNRKIVHALSITITEFYSFFFPIHFIYLFFNLNQSLILWFLFGTGSNMDTKVKCWAYEYSVWFFANSREIWWRDWVKYFHEREKKMLALTKQRQKWNNRKGNACWIPEDKPPVFWGQPNHALDHRTTMVSNYHAPCTPHYLMCHHIRQIHRRISHYCFQMGWEKPSTAGEMKRNEKKRQLINWFNPFFNKILLVYKIHTQNTII